MFDAIRRLFFGRARDAVLPEVPLPPLNLGALPPSDPQETIPTPKVAERLRVEREDADILLETTVAPQQVAHTTDLAVVIRYIDAKDEETERLVEIRSIIVSPTITYLQSYCYKRAAFRSFRLDRVDCAFDPQTGELFDLDDYIAKLGPGATMPIAASPSRPGAPRVSAPTRSRTMTPTAQMLDRSADGMRILLFLGRCDGDYHKSEHDVLVDYVRSACAIDDPDSDSAAFDVVEAETYLRRLRPNVRGFAGATSRLMAKPNRHHFDLVADEAFRLIEADGTIRPEETKFYNELGKLLRAG